VVIIITIYFLSCFEYDIKNNIVKIYMDNDKNNIDNPKKIVPTDNISVSNVESNPSSLDKSSVGEPGQNIETTNETPVSLPKSLFDKSKKLNNDKDNDKEDDDEEDNGSVDTYANTEENIPLYDESEKDKNESPVSLPESLFEKNKSNTNIEENNDNEESEDDMYLPSPPDDEDDTDTEREPDNQETVTKGTESYDYRGETFTVSVEEYLQKNMQVLNSEKKYTVYFCLYKVILDSYSPYLTYILSKKENQKLNATMYQFPSMKFQLSEIQNPLSPRTVKKITGGAENGNKFEAELMEEIYQTVYSFCADPQQIPSLEPFYRGFYLDNDDLYVVVDMTKLTINKENSSIIATPYEILVTRMVQEIAVHPSTTDFFHKLKDAEGTMDFYHLKRDDGEYVESPYALYMCKSNGFGGYSNIEIAANNNAQLFYPRIYNDDLGFTIMLTTHAFDANKADKMRRYAVFAEKETTLYIEPQQQEGEDAPINLADVYADDALEYNVITYLDKTANRQYWSVSTPLIIDEILV